MPESGMAVEVNVDPQGSELVTAALSTDTVLFVADASGYDAPGTVELNGIRKNFRATDVEAGTITLNTALGVTAGDVGDRVLVVSGGEIASDYTLSVALSDGDAIEIPLGYEQRASWAPGPVDPPIPVTVSDDLTKLLDTPGRPPQIAAEVAMPTGGSLVINGGDFRVLYPDGSGDILRIGDMLWGDRGLELVRDNGQPVLIFRKRDGAEQEQAWSMYDSTGNEIVAEQQFLQGLAKPYLEHPFQPVAATSGTAVTCGPYGYERTTSSGTFETLFVHDGKRQNALLDIKVAAFCSDGTTAGEIRAVNLDTGLVLPGFLLSPWLGLVPTGTTTMTIIDPAAGQTSLIDYTVGAPMRIGIQVRRTAGAGSITLAVPSAIGG